MDTVHSRIGLAFTGIVEIVVSTITSLSVCALVGFRVTMVPWYVYSIMNLLYTTHFITGRYSQSSSSSSELRICSASCVNNI